MARFFSLAVICLSLALPAVATAAEAAADAPAAAEGQTAAPKEGEAAGTGEAQSDGTKKKSKLGGIVDKAKGKAMGKGNAE